MTILPLNGGCPCGATVTDPNSPTVIVTDTLIDLALSGVLAPLKWSLLLQPLIGQMIDVAAICAAPRPAMPTFLLSDWTNQTLAAIKIAQAIRAKIYELNCSCVDCPPQTGCGQTDGYCVTYMNSAQESPQWGTYQIMDSNYRWIMRLSDGDCRGRVGPGLFIGWIIDPAYSPQTPLTISQNPGPGFDYGWNLSVYGEGVCIFPEGPQVTVPVPWPEAPEGVPEPIGPPACTNSDICTTLTYIAEDVRRIAFLIGVVAGPTYGVTAQYEMTLPGLTAPLVGALTDWLPRALTALAPISNSQLVNPTPTLITESTVVDVTTVAYMVITPTALPQGIGGTEQGIVTRYYTSMRSPGPGWIYVLGESGVLANIPLVYGPAVEFPVPPAATDIVVHLEPGVEATVTTYERQI